jgi:POT family proton-dependent oligopeptide transporter
MATDTTEVADYAEPKRRGVWAYLQRHPVGFWFIFWGELAERCAFYGIRALLFVYLTAVLGFSDAYATQVSATYKAGCYLAPLLGGFLADRFLGKYWVIVGFSIPYVIGMLLMGVGTEYAIYGGLALLALGSGAIKPNISTLMGLTYDEKRPGDTKIRGDAFYMFYFAINLGAVISSFFLPWVAKKDGLFEGNKGYFVGFMITAGLMTLALALFASGKRYYAREVVRGRAPLTPEERAEQWQTLGRIGGLFLLVAFWWCAYDFKDNVWIAFARDRIDLNLTPSYELLPNQLIALNPFLILILVPTLNLFWKLVDRNETRFPAPRKMFVGFVLMALTYVLLGAAGYMSEGASKVTILWMVAAFVVMTVSEVMVSVIGLELAFRAAPPRMKSFVTACWLLTVFLGNLITIPIARLKLYQEWGPGPFFLAIAGMMVVAASVFAVIGRRFQRQAA